MGAGAIGAYLGLMLSGAGVPVTLLGRQWLVDVRSELEAQSLDGRRVQPRSDLEVTTDVEALRGCNVCLVTVKSKDTVSSAQQLAKVLPEDAVVVSFQNGMRNPERLRKHLPQRVAAGMVSFNVVIRDDRVFRHATSGPLYAASLKGRAAPLLDELSAAFRRAGQPLELRRDMPNVMAGKLLVNLNNGVCAATGLTVANTVRSPALRRCFSATVLEGLEVLRASGLEPARVVALPPAVMARALLLPNSIFLRVAKSLVTIDPSAKSSTLQDLEKGKPTEIDDLNGELVTLAQRRGMPAPVNRVVLDTVHELEGQTPPEFLSVEAFVRRIEEARDR